MPIVRLGPIRFGWCMNCNIPILDVRYECGLCGSKPESVSVTPPGDVRPAFEHDIELLRNLADAQFGEGCGSVLFPKDKLVVLNKAPALDRMDEVIIDGQVLCTLKFDVENDRGYKLLLRMEGARRIERKAKKNWVLVSDDAAPYIIKGASVMVPGILEADEGMRKGEEVVVLNLDRQAIAAGSARMNGKDMTALDKGAATKTRWSSEPRAPTLLAGGKTWEHAVEGNRDAMERRIKESTKFINAMTKKYERPMAVSFSGGKDSLATLLLVLDAGRKPRILFVDTGLEFKETVEYVHRLTDKMGLELIVENADQTFWVNLWSFGPPSKDFRWCCKSCKLGPTTRLIRKHFEHGVLNFVGQRRYESQLRNQKGNVWKNPWVPGQLAASPVQNWTALHVWLYIFMKKAEYNPWYERGLERIGCFLCPASDLAELELVEETYDEYRKWNEFLKRYADKKGYPDDWLKYGLWRWKSPPKELRRFVKPEEIKKEETGGMELNFVEGYTPCAEGLSMEGMFSTKLDIERVGNTMNILSGVERDEEIRACRADNMLIFEEGAVVIKGKNEEELKSKRILLGRLIRKSLYCVGCGTCLGLCEEDAIKLENGRSWIDNALCIHCGKCLSPCPAAEFKGEFRF